MKRFDPDMSGADADEGPKFDSSDVEAERRSDEVFNKLDVYERFEIVRVGTAFTKSSATTFARVLKGVAALGSRRGRRSHEEYRPGFDA